MRRPKVKRIEDYDYHDRLRCLGEARRHLLYAEMSLRSILQSLDLDPEHDRTSEERALLEHWYAEVQKLRLEMTH